MYTQLYMLENINSGRNNVERTRIINEIRSQLGFDQSTVGDGHDMTNVNQVPSHADIQDIDKALRSGKYYMLVTWMDGPLSKIQQKYSDNLHSHLSELSETPSPGNCDCDACWIQRNDI